MPSITFKDGVLSAEEYVQVTRDHTCQCGANCTITLNMPKDVSYNSEINIKDVNCPNCGAQVVIPKGHHYIEGSKLLTK